jgi:TIR domain
MSSVRSGSPRIFINYRQEGTSGHAGRLYDALAARFGRGHVFMDIDAIPPGADFAKVVNEYVGSSDVVIALIGKHWTTVVDQQGRRRIDKPEDWVRVELETALERSDTRVIRRWCRGAGPGAGRAATRAPSTV